MRLVQLERRRRHHVGSAGLLLGVHAETAEVQLLQLGFAGQPQTGHVRERLRQESFELGHALLGRQHTEPQPCQVLPDTLGVLAQLRGLPMRPVDDFRATIPALIELVGQRADEAASGGVCTTVGGQVEGVDR